MGPCDACVKTCSCFSCADPCYSIVSGSFYVCDSGGGFGFDADFAF